MQYQDGRQGTYTMLISQEPTFRSMLFQRLLDYIDNNYHLDHVIRIRIDDVIMQYQDGRQRTPHETLVRPQRPQ